MVAAAVLAGGQGARFGGEKPKQFAEIGGEAILIRSLRAFVCSGLVDLCIVSVPAAWIAETESLIAQTDLGQRCPVRVIAGGDSRGQTLLQTLTFLEHNGMAEDTVLITHDAVRPFVTRRMIRDNIAAAEKFGACNTCIPATDTVFFSADGAFVSEVPDRRTVFHAQTPQSFLGAQLYALCRQVPAADFAAMTDGCSVYAYFGKPVAMVAGERDNIKITYPGDLDRAEQILKTWKY